MMKIDRTTGLIENIQYIVSPNHDDRPDDTDISLLVIHGISLPPSEYGSPCIEQLFTNCLDPDEHPFFQEIKDLRVSSHLLIRRDGSLIQFVPFQKRAWHAGVSSFEGREHCNDFSIGIELEGTDEDAYENAQYHCLAEVSKAIMKVYPKITQNHIRGHCHIAPGRKTDPGPGFDWDRFYGKIKA